MATSKRDKAADMILRQRQVTGICETCGGLMETHSKCAACGILIGQGHLNIWPLKYEGHDLCCGCIIHWQNLDKTIGRPTTFEEFADSYSQEYKQLRWGVKYKGD